MNFLTIVYLIMFFFGIYFLVLFILLFLKNKKSLYSYPIPTKFPFISFITPAYNEEETIEETIKAILAVDYPKDKREIIIVNDGSKDRTEEIVRRIMKNHKEVRLLNKKNSGKADSLNQGIKMAKGAIIAIVDADSQPTKESVKRMIGYFEKDDVAAVTSRVLIKNKRNFIEKFQEVDYAVIAWGRKVLDFIDCVYVTNGPLSLYRKDVVVKIGGFDPKNLTEDIELTWNLLSKDYKTRMSYSALVYTTVPSHFKKWNGQRVRWNLGGMQTVRKYWKSMLSKNIFGYFVVTFVTLAFILAFLSIILLLKFFITKLFFYFSLIPFIFKGYNPFKFVHFDFYITIIFIFGVIFFILSMLYYSLMREEFALKTMNLRILLVYIFIYRSLYIIPLIMAVYKLAKGELGWYTK